MVNNLASLLSDHRADDKDAVERAYTIASRLRPSDLPQYRDTYGWTRYLKGEYDIALERIAPVAGALPNNPWVHYHLGMVYAALKQPEKARPHLEAALQLSEGRPFKPADLVRETLAGLCRPIALSGMQTTPGSASPKPTRVLIHGLGRSGTSWLMKIFDHHPMVFASHEPEVFIPRPDFADLSPQAAKELAEGYLDRLFTSRPLRAMRKRPIRRKAYRSGVAHELRRGLLYGLSAADRVLKGKWAGAPVPDLASLDHATQVVKCVSHQMVLDQVMAHAPDVKVIFLIRHPCGNVFSNLTGQSIDAMHGHFLPARAELARLFEFDRPVESLSEAEFSQTEILAYRWAVFNDRVYRGLHGQPNARLLSYEALCADPIAMARALFGWVGLDWHPDCEAFLAASIASKGDASGYHDLTRNPMTAANKWRDQMPPADQERVLAICRRSAAFALFEPGTA